MPADREALAAAQAALLGALVEEGAPPEGFDPARVRATAEALSSKRASAVRRALPRLAASLGSGFAARFGAYASEHPLGERGGPLADGLAFAASLGPLPEEAERERLTALLHRHRAWGMASGRLGGRRVLLVRLAGWVGRLPLGRAH